MKRLTSTVLILALLAVGASALGGRLASRRGDLTTHGGTIITGSPDVFICGQGAARLGDRVTCPLATPVLGGVIPHVGGPITASGTTVLINGLPAARMGDLVVETGPPSQLSPGCATVLIGP